MKYWGEKASADGANYFTANALIAEADGKCGAWGQLLVATLALQQVESSIAEVVSLKITSGGRELMLVKNYDFHEIQAFPGEMYTHKMNSEKFNPNAGYTTDLVGISGQNNEKPNSVFSNHALVFYESKYYDPSYGKIFDSLLAFESFSIEGYSERASWFGIPKCRKREDAEGNIMRNLF